MFKIGNRKISVDEKPFIIAEISGNHGGSFTEAKSLVLNAYKSGADAVKFQTYTPDTITLKSSNTEFMIQDKKSIWYGKNLYDLYKEAMTPWEWIPNLFEYAKELGIIAFSSPFDSSAVEFLETLDAPCYKIASVEKTDFVLLESVAKTKKPIIISAGMATLTELSESISFLRKKNSGEIAILKCTSSYPAPPSDTNLKTIPTMKEIFNCEIGISDHTLGIGVSVGAVTLGASIIEKHITNSRTNGYVDSIFSLEPTEFENLVTESFNAWQAIGKVEFGMQESEMQSSQHRRSLYYVEDMKKGDLIKNSSVRSVRPGIGLSTKYFHLIISKQIKRDVKYGEPVLWDDF